MFNIEYNLENGGVESIVHAQDDAKMNWVEGASTFGLIKTANVVSVEKTNDGVIAKYSTKKIN